jgi:DNA (cytosine-5)-methyltransferase 1
MSDTIHAVDLFCGAGGTLEGLSQTCADLGYELDVVAVNHWETAIETHRRNHPGDHHVSKVEELHPPDVADDVDLLIASPECTHFSVARGGKPVNEQKRASPWHVLDWVEKLQPANVLLENVREFKSWGPIDDGQPTRNGEIFETWIDAFHSLGYSVDYEVLNAADYGDPTTRKRLFVVGRRGRRASFPEPTHSEDGTGDTEEWRSAAEIIDWSDVGKSLWQRDRPLVNNTMQRIAEGIREHCADTLEPFADAVAELGKDDVARMQDDVVDAGEQSVHDVAEQRCEPFLVKYYGTATAKPLDEPIDTITAEGGKFALCTPYLLGQQSGATARDVDEPVPTIATKGAIGLYNPQPFVLPRNGARGGLHSNATYEPSDRPLHTVTAKNQDGHLVTPFLVPYYSEREGQTPRTHALDEPLPTVTATGSDPYLCEPFLVEYYGNGQAQDLEAPLPTVTTRDRFALVVPDALPFGIDIRYRMLQPRELAAAMGFPPEYDFAGNKTETTKQIGNAVPVNLAKALTKQLLTGEEPSLGTYTQEAEADD